MQRIIPHFLLLVALLAACLAYRPGLNGSFVFDDDANIVSNPQLAIHDLNLHTLKQAAFSSASGPLLRPISMMSFAANYYATGLDPFYFKLTNLIIHLLNGIGVFILTRLLLNFYRKRFAPGLSVGYAAWLSLAVSSAWLLHPLNLTSVLYVVQRMTSLSAFFSIWGLVIFLWGRTRLYEGKSGILLILASLLLFTPLAAFSKENGALLPLLMLVAEATLFTFHAEKLFARRFLIGFYTLSVVIPVVVALIYLAIHPGWLLAGYANRGFTLLERLMTETRVLWFYMSQIMLPNTAQMGLYLDDIPVSHGLLQPVSTLFATVGLMVLGVLAVLLRKRVPLVAFGIGFFLVGHVLESTIYPLDIAYEHRNYLPMYGIVLPMFFYLLNPVILTKYLRLRQVAAVLLIFLFAFGTFSRSNSWANPVDFSKAEFNHHPNSVRSNIELASVYSGIATNDPLEAENYYLLARQHYENAASLDKNDTGGLLGLILLTSKKNKPVEPEWVKELSYRLEHVPYVAIISDKLLNLANCKLGGGCELSNIDLENLLKAALRNPTLTGPMRSKVLFAMSSYLINVTHDYPAALAVMHQMVEATPGEPAVHLALAKFLTALQRADEAKVEITKTRSLDKYGNYAQELEQIEQQLTELKKPLPITAK